MNPVGACDECGNHQELNPFIDRHEDISYLCNDCYADAVFDDLTDRMMEEEIEEDIDEEDED